MAEEAEDGEEGDAAAAAVAAVEAVEAAEAVALAPADEAVDDDDVPAAADEVEAEENEVNALDGTSRIKLRMDAKDSSCTAVPAMHRRRIECGPAKEDHSPLESYEG